MNPHFNLFIKNQNVTYESRLITLVSEIYLQHVIGRVLSWAGAITFIWLTHITHSPLITVLFVNTCKTFKVLQKHRKNSKTSHFQTNILCKYDYGQFLS